MMEFVTGNFWTLCLLVLLTLVVLPSVFGISLGISEAYVKILTRIIQWTTKQIQDELQKKRTLTKHYSPTGIIHRGEITMKEAIASQRREGFEFSDVFYFSKKGLEAIVEDEVTQRFTSEEPISWNLLTRTSINYQYLNLKLTLVWFLGFLFRYLFLVPFR
ncbi:glycerol-3-phosphate acyltransferase 3 [Eublepharis macularius]|uniref:Glycerol-3-phosphate acyltransferase 3 n=1 Tax=Eublepharis macularius TaxID=481883 RepID=A0AA97JVQ6_EUBMA|nr:glycerol-3-phosphate acyltransferase 3 [Eublepharis macularius]